jgi:sulfur carrier protein
MRRGGGETAVYSTKSHLRRRNTCLEARRGRAAIELGGIVSVTTVVLRNPRREIQVTGGRRVKDILRELDVVPETVLVIRGDELITADQTVRDDDVLELRPVMSGGAS